MKQQAPERLPKRSHSEAKIDRETDIAAATALQPVVSVAACEHVVSSAAIE
jgi:hypothetical protein